MQEKLNLLTDLIRLANVDKNIRNEEYEFILDVAGRLGISEEEVNTAFSENIESRPPKMESDRILQFYRLVLLMNVDQNASHVEKVFIRDLSIKMGLNPIATEQVINEMDKHPSVGIKPERLVQIFNEYHN